MPKRRNLTAFWLVAAAIWALCFRASLVGAADGKSRLVVVVADSSQLKDISMHDLKRLYLGEHVSDPDGQKLIPFNHPPGAQERVGFDRVVLDMSPEQVGRYWVDRKIRGQSGPPRSIDSPIMIQRVVTQLRGGIGYVRASDVRADVRVLSVNGKTYKDGDYPIEY